MVRGAPSGSGGGLGLTMSEEGGLDEVEESLRAAASCSRRLGAPARAAPRRGLQGVHLRLQPLTVGTGGAGVRFHAAYSIHMPFSRPSYRERLRNLKEGF